MEYLARPDEWIAPDSENLAKFLDTDTGKRLLSELSKGCPELLVSGDTNAIMIRTGEVRAFSRMIEQLLLLAHPPAPSPSHDDAYPALTDDSKWADGQKLAVPPATDDTKT